MTCSKINYLTEQFMLGIKFLIYQVRCQEAALLFESKACVYNLLQVLKLLRPVEQILVAGQIL